MDDEKWLIAREIPRLRRYAMVLTRDETAADDLVQDTLERAIRKRHLWKRHGSIRGWLYRVLHNVFVNQGHHRDRIRRQLTLDSILVSHSVPARQEHHLACREIGEAMASLPTEQRTAIALTAVEGFAYDEAAKILGIPIGTLRSRIFRGRETLRARYDGEARREDRAGYVHLRRVK